MPKLTKNSPEKAYVEFNDYSLPKIVKQQTALSLVKSNTFLARNWNNSSKKIHAKYKKSLELRVYQ